MSERHFVCRTSEIPPGTGKEFAIAGRIVAVYHVDEEFHAIDGICAHAGGPLGKGALSGCIVTCPWHGWQYDIRTGKHCLTSHISQTRYQLDVSGEEIFVEI